MQGGQATTESTVGSTTERAPKVKEKTMEKTREKTREKIIQAVNENPVITTNGLAEILGITVKGVEWQIKDLKSRGIIRRVGPAKGGHWEIIEK